MHRVPPDVRCSWITAGQLIKNKERPDKMTIGRLERVPLREVWQHEALDFTRWLEDHLEVLNEILELELVSAERETNAGSFSCDLLAEDASGAVIVIENQLETSDHRHLGQILTYAAALEATGAIWIVARPRPEHVKAVQWLNEQTEVPFYLIQAEAVQIGSSAPAPLLTKIVGPSVEARAAGRARREYSELRERQHRFWSLLLTKARERTRLHGAISPQPESWVGAGAGMSGLSWNYSLRRNDTRVELYIDRGDEEENGGIFDRLVGHRNEVEDEFGEALNWDRLEQRRACRISKRLHNGGWGDEERWPAIAEATVDAMVRLEGSLRPYVRALSS